MQEKYIIDNNDYPLGKDINGNLVYVKEVQAIVFSIVKEIDRVCRKNNIQYALAYGSALGIINYQGFIPWDDDADIAIDYFDIPRLVEAFKNDLSPDFEFVCYEKDNRYNILIPTMKVIKKTGYMQDKNHATLPDHIGAYEGFFVDIVAFIGMKNKRQHFFSLLKSKLRLLPYFISDVVFKHDPKGMKKRMKKGENKLANKNINSKYVCQTTCIPFQTTKHNLYPRDIIFPFKEYIFNGLKVYSFNDIRAFCAIKYGEVCFKKEVNGEMIDPLPESRRKALHIGDFSLTEQKK